MHDEIAKVLNHFDESMKRMHRRDRRCSKLRNRSSRKPIKTPVLYNSPQKKFNDELEHRKRSEAFCRSVSKRLKGRELPDCHRKRISLSLNAKWILISPTGKEYLVDNLKKFCKKNDLGYKSMTAVHAGRLKTHQGWLCKKLDNYNENFKKLQLLLQSTQ